MIKLNGYWYSYTEVREALEKKGYVVIHETDTDRRGNTINIWIAVKDGKTQPMESAAIEEFHKKPPLV